jgi:peroxiredoxin Q/BCP
MKDNNLKEGDIAPDFELKDYNGVSLSLSSLRGKYVVLYFYPKDDTPGCTIEAKSFRDSYQEFLSLGVAVVGISVDDQSSHKRFCEKYALPFPLLSDENHEVVKAYGVWGSKSLYGKIFEGTNRITFVIDPDGKISKIWKKVNVNGHTNEVLDYVRSLV